MSKAQVKALRQEWLTREDWDVEDLVEAALNTEPEPEQTDEERMVEALEKHQ